MSSSPKNSTVQRMFDTSLLRSANNPREMFDFLLGFQFVFKNWKKNLVWILNFREDVQSLTGQLERMGIGVKQRRGKFPHKNNL